MKYKLITNKELPLWKQITAIGMLREANIEFSTPGRISGITEDGFTLRFNSSEERTLAKLILTELYPFISIDE